MVISLKGRKIKVFFTLILFLGLTLTNSKSLEVKASSNNNILKPDEVFRHTYEFYIDGVLDPERTQVLTNGELLRHPGEAEPIPNKRFDGWFKEGEDQETRFGIHGTPVTVNSNETIRYYGKFTDIVYVTFINDALGTENDKVIRVKSLSPGETTDGNRVPLVVLQRGKAFSHWSTVKNGPPFDFSQPINKNTVLYSVLANKWKVTFNSDGGVNRPPQFVNAGSTAEPPEPPTKIGYTFKEWQDEIGNVFNFNTPITGDRTLKAIWTPNATTNYRVVYLQEKRDGPNTVDNYSVKETVIKTGQTGADAAFVDKTPQYPGYELDVEKTNAAKTTIAPDGNTIRRVYYKRKRYELRFFGPGRYSWSPPVLLKTIPGIKQGENTAPYWDPVANQYNRYSWYTTNGGSIAYTAPPDMPNGNLNVYGRVAAGYDYTIFYRERIGTTNTNQDVKVPFYLSGPNGLYLTIEDYIAVPGFTVYSTPNDGSQHSTYNYNTGRYEWRIYYTRNNYSITFHTNDGGTGVVESNIPYQSDISGKEPDGYIVGETKKVINGLEHTFTGWYEDISAVGSPVTLDGKTMPAENLILYAGWEPSRHKVDVHKVIDPDGEHEYTPEIDHMQPITSVIQERDLHKIKPDGADGEGDFLGWYWFQRENIFVPFDFNTPIFQDIELFPVWKNVEHRLLYDLNGGTPKESLKDNNFYLPYTHGIVKDPIAEGVNPPSKAPLFLGWQGENGELHHINSLVYMDKETIELEAEWGPLPRETAQITYDPNGGNGEVKKLTVGNNSTHVVQDDAFAEGEMYTRPGYTFTGWNTEKDGSGQSFQKGDQILVQKGKTNILYAQWETQATVNIVAIKKWEVQDENNDKFDYTLQLYRDGEPDGEPVTVPKNTESYTWSDKPKEVKNGSEFHQYEYTVKELNIPDGYREHVSEPEISPDGSTITYEITNYKRSFLPATGGLGFKIFNMIAGILASIGVFLAFKKFDIFGKIQKTIR